MRYHGLTFHGLVNSLFNYFGGYVFVFFTSIDDHGPFADHAVFFQVAEVFPSVVDAYIDVIPETGGYLFDIFAMLIAAGAGINKFNLNFGHDNLAYFSFGMAPALSEVPS
jgi:hypothetical protein